MLEAVLRYVADMRYSEAGIPRTKGGQLVSNMGAC